MSERVINAIVQVFDDDSTLVAALGTLATGGIPDPTDRDKPFCVLVPEDEVKEERTMGGATYVRRRFEFHTFVTTAADDVLVALRTHDANLKTVFQDSEATLNAEAVLSDATITVLDFHKTDGRHDPDPDGAFYESVQIYEAMWSEP